MQGGPPAVRPPVSKVRVSLNNRGKIIPVILALDTFQKTLARFGNLMTKKKIPDKFQIWIDARKKYHLSHAQIQMARELGMNPKNFGKLAENKQQRWKVPLPQFIEELYFKHFGKVKPDQVISIEEKVRGIQQKKDEKAQKQHGNQETEIQPYLGEV